MVEVVKEGETIGERKVQKQCEINAKGHWFCAKHREGFKHNLAKDCHLNNNKGCRLAWFCWEHNEYEVP